MPPKSIEEGTRKQAIKKEATKKTKEEPKKRRTKSDRDFSSDDSESTKKKPKKSQNKRQSGRQINHNIVSDDIIMIYPDIENPIEGPVKMNRETTHSAPQVKISEDGLTVSNEKVYWK